VSANYVCRLLPIGRIFPHPDGEMMLDQFSFRGQARRAAEIPVLLDHNPRRPVGKLRSLAPIGAWWVAEFSVDPQLTHSCVAQDRLRVGTPVSAHWISTHLGPTGLLENVEYAAIAELKEISVVREGLVDGAAITHILNYPSVARTAQSQAEPRILRRQTGELLRSTRGLM